MVIDADDPDLKQLFDPVIKEEIFHHHANHLVENTNKHLSDAGYKTQIFPREINFFYLDRELRERIVEEDGQYKVLNTSLKFSKEEMRKLIDREPEKFSPNVVLRPLYQEMILPNLAYIGGPAEMAYWMQLKPVFDHYQVDFPMLLPRNFALIISGTLAKKIEKLGLSVKMMFCPAHELKDIYIHQNTSHQLDLEEEKSWLSKVFEQINEKALSVDQSLEGFVGAELARTQKILENIEKRMKKAEEQNQAIGLRQIENLKSRLFPNDNLQERTDNFLNFYFNNKDFLNVLMEYLDPFDFRFNVLIGDE